MEEGPISVVKIDFEGGQEFTSYRRKLGVTSFGINLLTLRPRQRFRVHRHQRQEEVYVVMAGELTLVVEGDGGRLEDHVLGRGMAARVGPSTRRQLTNQGTEPVEVLALGGSGEHQSRDAIAWSSWDEPGQGRPPTEVPLPDDLPA